MVTKTGVRGSPPTELTDGRRALGGLRCHSVNPSGSRSRRKRQECPCVRSYAETANRQREKNQTDPHENPAPVRLQTRAVDRLRSVRIAEAEHSRFRPID